MFGKCCFQGSQRYAHRDAEAQTENLLRTLPRDLSQADKTTTTDKLRLGVDVGAKRLGESQSQRSIRAYGHSQGPVVESAIAASSAPVCGLTIEAVATAYPDGIDLMTNRSQPWFRRPLRTTKKMRTCGAEKQVRPELTDPSYRAPHNMPCLDTQQGTYSRHKTAIREWLSAEANRPLNLHRHSSSIQCGSDRSPSTGGNSQPDCKQRQSSQVRGLGGRGRSCSTVSRQHVPQEL